MDEIFICKKYFEIQTPIELFKINMFEEYVCKFFNLIGGENNLVMVSSSISVYYFYNNNNEDFNPQFFDYFFTDKELRKIKLEKINEINRNVYLQKRL